MTSKQFSLKSLGIPYAFIPAAFFLGANIVLNPHILSLRGINILALQTVSIAFAVMAQTLVLIVRELDMSIGAMVSMTTVIVASTFGKFHLFSIVIALIAAAALGFFSGAIVAWVKIPGIVVTLAASMLIGGFALVIMPQPGGDIDALLGDLVNGQPLLIPNSLLLLIFALFIWNYVKNTRLGISLFASGGNPFSAYASGLSVEQAKIAAYVGSGLLSALAGIIVAGKTMTGDATIGDPYTLNSITGTVLGGASFFGGVGTMRGAIAGAVIIGVLVNILFFLGLSSHYQNIAEGLILLAAVLIGLSSNKERQS